MGRVVADFNRDGWLDLIVGSYYDRIARYHDTGTTIFWGSPEGFRECNAQWLPGATPVGLTVADFDGDGHLDYLSPHYHGTATREAIACYLYWGGPDGLRRSRRTILIADSVSDAMAGDFDRDGLLDVACPATPATAITTRTQRSSTTTGAGSPSRASPGCRRAGRTGCMSRTSATSITANGNRPTSPPCSSGINLLGTAG